MYKFRTGIRVRLCDIARHCGHVLFSTTYPVVCTFKFVTILSVPKNYDEELEICEPKFTI